MALSMVMLIRVGRGCPGISLESGIDPSQVAFTYRNAITGEQFAMNDLQPMTAGSTYKLPLNMLVVDEGHKGETQFNRSV